MEETGNINYRNAQFILSAAKLDQCPPDTGKEVAFAGRSNAGKSSALNALTCSKKLARTSKTPGRTQLINFFQIGDNRHLVDLPGYGYAKVPEKIKKEWQQHLSHYLESRKSLCGLVLLMDIRHPLREFDHTILNWAKESMMPVHILLTKSDKLKTGAAKNALNKVTQSLSSMDNPVSVQLFSATKKSGIENLILQLDQWLI